MPKPTIKYAVLYARFSPRPHSEDCDSVEKQLADLRKWCAANGYTVAGEFSDEAFSGADHERPGVWDAIAALKRGYTLVVRHMDRLARDTLLALTLEREIAKAGARLVGLETGGEHQGDEMTAEFLRTIFHAFATYQRKLGNAKTKARMQKHQAGGRVMSDKLPYGYEIDPASPPHPESGRPTGMIENVAEQAAIARIRQLRLEGRKLRAIARQLDREGYPSRNGQWQHVTVRRILDRIGIE